jgi:aminoglycoside 3-N-acetyltransferase
MLSRYLSKEQKRFLKAAYFKVKREVIGLVASYTPDELEAKFRSLGIDRNDSVLMHSSFSQFTGFKGDPGQVIDRLLTILGPQGHLFMLSMAYTSSSYDYIKKGKPFDVRRTVSRMGVISEGFRRRQCVVRSANPLHPVLAWGPKAQWVVAGHDDLLYSCGPDSPFDKMLELNTKMLFFEVGFETCTFMHFVEDRFKDSAPLPVYHHTPLEGVVIDQNGCEKRVRAHVFDPPAIRRRNFAVVEQSLVEGGFLRHDRIGNTKLSMVRTTEVLACTKRLVDQGRHLYRN